MTSIIFFSIEQVFFYPLKKKWNGKGNYVTFIHKFPSSTKVPNISWYESTNVKVTFWFGSSSLALKQPTTVSGGLFSGIELGSIYDKVENKQLFFMLTL